MMEWRIVERRKRAAWRGFGPNALFIKRSRPGALRYFLTGLSLIAGGVLAIFSLVFFLIVVLPLLAIGGLILFWRWRQWMRAHQEELNPSHRTAPSFSRGRYDDNVIDV